MPSLKRTAKRGKNTVFDEGPISLSFKLESWLREIEVDLEEYKRELELVFSNKKCRYYRTVDKSHSTEDPLVNWLRDADVYVSNRNVDKKCYGIDAASAAVVDALRLKGLCNCQEAWILDMCCAPGGKLLATIDAINRLESPCRWNVIGLESVNRRLDVCRSMLSKETYDRERISVSLKCTRSQEFNEHAGENMLGKFDRVVLDVECTHEGSLRSVIRTIKYWGIESLESKWNREYASRIIANQRELLLQAMKLIKPGGFIVYSTCSLDREQNEGLVSEVLGLSSGFKYYPLPVNSCGCCSTNSDSRTGSWPCESCEATLSQISGSKYFYGGDDTANCKNRDSPVAVRFVPFKGRTDGLFIALLLRVA